MRGYRCLQRSEHDEVPWVQRDSSEALHLLAAARQGRTPQRRVERLALLQLLMQLHRQAHERTGEEPSTASLELQGQHGSAASAGSAQAPLMAQEVYALLYSWLAQT